jgi:gluconate 5-dehydrogenase
MYKLGAHVVLLGRSPEKLSIALSHLDLNGLDRASFESCDVADEASLTQAAHAVFSRYTKVDILVTCAATSAVSGKFEAISLSEWRSLLATDLDGVFLACRIFGSSMIKQRHGRIINLTSFHNVATYPYRTLYNVAKSGVEGLSRALAVEWGHYGITVNSVAPGPIMTPRTQWFLSQDERNAAGMLARTPNRRIGQLQDVSSIVAFLASDEARHINGQQIVVDGGWTKNAWWGNHSELE